MTTQADTTVSHPAPEPTPGPAHRPAPWVRTRLGAGPLAAVLMAALAFVTVFLSAALPRVSDRGANAALRDYMGRQSLNLASLQSSSRTQLSDTAAELDGVQKKLTARIGQELPLSKPGEAYGTKALTGGPMLNPGYARLTEDAPPSMNVLYLHGLADRVTLTDGTWPASTPAALGEPLPIVMSGQAAEKIGVKLGDVIDNDGAGPRSTRHSLVVGFYRVNDPRDPYWDDLGCPDRACLHIAPKGAAWWKTTAFVDGANVSALSLWGSGGENFWRLPLDAGALRADLITKNRASIASFQTGPGATALVTATGRRDLRTSSDLTDLLNRAEARYEAAMPLSAIGPVGVAGVAVVVLCLAAALTTDRRSAEIRLLQARGGSRGGVLLRLLGEGLVTVVPAAVLATVLALVLLPTPRWGYAVLAALAATALALLAFPLRAALLWSRGRAPGGWRRVIGELAVLAVTAAAVTEVRRRGVGQSGAATDPLLVAAPLLLAVSGGLVLARIEPVAVGWLASLAGRGRGLIGFLGLTRASRDTSGRRRPSVLPLLALLIAVTATGFGATVLDTVDTVRTRAARVTTGGDVSVVIPEYATLPEAFGGAAAELPGVRSATGLWVEPKALFIGADQGYTQAALVVAEPKAYAEIAHSLGVGEFDPAKLAGTPGGPDTPVPALFSRDLAKRLAAGTPKVRTPSGNELRTTVAGIVTATPALPDPGTPFVVVPAGPAAERMPELKRTNRWAAVGDVDPDRVRTALLESGLTQPTGMAKLVSEEAAAAGKTSHGLPAGYTVHSSGEKAAQLADDPLQHAAGRLFWYAASAAAGFALLAVLLTLFRAAPDRTAVLARLRTMGLRPRQGLALIIAEALPQTLTAVVGGGLIAVSAVALLGPAFDLSTLVGARVRDTMAPVLMPVLLPTAGLAVLVCLVVVVETLVAGRRQIATELRAGDQS